MLPRGIILMWYGSIASIPSGFALCDGNNGTPDLRSRFVIGAGGALDPGDTGGATTHTHDFTAEGHFHTIDGGSDIEAGSGYSEETDTLYVTGTTESKSNMPPYHALAYIMKT